MKKLHKRTYTDLWHFTYNGHSGQNLVIVQAQAPKQGALLRLDLPLWQARELAIALLRGMRKVKEAHERAARWAEERIVTAVEAAKTDPPKGGN